MQQFLYFFPLPHGHGSLRPTFFSTILGLGRFSNSVKSEISSGLSGSSSILYFHPFSSNAAVTSFNLLSVCTVTTAGFFSVPNFACFTPSKIRIRFPTSVILLPIPLLFQISWDLSIPRRKQGDQHETSSCEKHVSGPEGARYSAVVIKSGDMQYLLLGKLVRRAQFNYGRPGEDLLAAKKTLQAL